MMIDSFNRYYACSCCPCSTAIDANSVAGIAPESAAKVGAGAVVDVDTTNVQAQICPHSPRLISTCTCTKSKIKHDHRVEESPKRHTSMLLHSSVLSITRIITP